VWLSADKNGELSILQCPNADNPVAHGLKPLLTFDVWEHAYYLDHQNRRAAHLKALWPTVDWNVVGERYTK
jgi:Fe-Mn family superoxide dismutase